MHVTSAGRGRGDTCVIKFPFLFLSSCTYLYDEALDHLQGGISPFIFPQQRMYTQSEKRVYDVLRHLRLPSYPDPTLGSAT